MSLLMFGVRPLAYVSFSTPALLSLSRRTVGIAGFIAPSDKVSVFRIGRFASVVVFGIFRAVRDAMRYRSNPCYRQFSNDVSIL